MRSTRASSRSGADPCDEIADVLAHAPAEIDVRHHGDDPCAVLAEAELRVDTGETSAMTEKGGAAGRSSLEAKAVSAAAHDVDLLCGHLLERFGAQQLAAVERLRE